MAGQQYSVRKLDRPGDPRKWYVIRSDGFIVSIHRTRAAAAANAVERNTRAAR